MKTSSAHDKSRLGLQAGTILITSAAVGLAYNALNPGGLSWEDPALDESAEQKEAPASLYRSETISARLVGGPVKAVAAAPVPAAAVPKKVTPPRPAVDPKDYAAATAVRTTWAKMQPLVDRGEVVLVDSRSAVAFKAGHIPGAVNLSLKQVDEMISDFLANHSPPDARIVIYCSNAKCASSAKLAALLTNDYGYDHVQYVPGGYLEWRQSNRETKSP